MRTMAADEHDPTPDHPFTKEHVRQEMTEVMEATSAELVPAVNVKKLLRKMDCWLLPWLSFLYLLSFLDRSSIGNARVCI